MTLEELKTRCEAQGFKYAYGKFYAPVEPPHLVTMITDTDNLMADNKVWGKKTPIKLDYTYVYKNIEEQNKIEDIILSDVAWNKTDETYFEDEECFQVSYFFELIGGND